MEYVGVAIQKALAYYLFRVGALCIVILLGILYVCRDKPKSERIGALTVVLIVVLVIYLVNSVVPFVADIVNNDILTAHGVYTNKLGDNSKSSSSLSGLYAVELTVNDEILQLTTAPWSQEIFVQGTYEVAAYYTFRSKILLYIQIVD